MKGRKAMLNQKDKNFRISSGFRGADLSLKSLLPKKEQPDMSLPELKPASFKFTQCHHQEHWFRDKLRLPDSFVEESPKIVFSRFRKKDFLVKGNLKTPLKTEEQEVARTECPSQDYSQEVEQRVRTLESQQGGPREKNRRRRYKEELMRLMDGKSREEFAYLRRLEKHIENQHPAQPSGQLAVPSGQKDNITFGGFCQSRKYNPMAIVQRNREKVQSRRQQKQKVFMGQLLQEGEISAGDRGWLIENYINFQCLLWVQQQQKGKEAMDLLEYSTLRQGLVQMQQQSEQQVRGLFEQQKVRDGLVDLGGFLQIMWLYKESESAQQQVDRFLGISEGQAQGVLSEEQVRHYARIGLQSYLSPDQAVFPQLVEYFVKFIYRAVGRVRGQDIQCGELKAAMGGEEGAVLRMFCGGE